MSQWQVLDLLEYKGEVHGDAGHLFVAGRSIPLADLAVVLLGLSVRLSGGLLVRLAEADVMVLPCDWRGVPVAAQWPWATNVRTGARMEAQRALSAERADRMWALLVRAKILGQAANLRWTAPVVAEKLSVLASVVAPGDPANVEARAARRYWECVFEDFTFCRDQRAMDARNAALNYGYTVLRGFVLHAVCAAGLLPGLGIHHANRANPFALVDDLMEPFRPAIDATVARFGDACELRERTVREALVGVLSSPFGQGRETLRTSVAALAASFGQAVEDSDLELCVPVWPG